MAITSRPDRRNMRGVVVDPEAIRTIRFGRLTAWNALKGNDGCIRKVRFLCDCGQSIEVTIEDIRFSGLYNRNHGKSLMPTSCGKCSPPPTKEKRNAE